MKRLKKIFVLVFVIALLVNNFAGVTTVSAEVTDSDLPEGLAYVIVDDEVKITNYSGTATELKIPVTIEGYPVTSLNSFFLQKADHLKSVFIPKTVKNVTSMTFLYCETLEVIDVDKESEFFASIEGVLYTKDLKTLVKYPDNKNGSYFMVPDGVNKLAECSFMYCYNLTALSLPTSLETIGDSAFYHEDITDVYYKGSETEWGNIEIDKTFPQLAEATIHYNYGAEPTIKPSDDTNPTKSPSPINSIVPTNTPTTIITSKPTETPNPTESVSITESPEFSETPIAISDVTETKSPEQTAKTNIKTDKNSDKADGIGTGAIIGIIALCIVIAGGAGAVVYFFIIKKK